MGERPWRRPCLCCGPHCSRRQRRRRERCCEGTGGYTGGDRGGRGSKLEEDRTNGDDINAAVRELENTLEEIEESIDSEATEDEDYENSNDLGSGTDDDVEVIF